MKRILITGAAGKIGSVLQFFAPAGARYGRVPVPASSSEPREIHTVMVPPRWAGGTYTPSLPALAPHSATRAAVRRNAAAASAEAGGGTDGATCGSRADATGGSRAGAVAAGAGASGCSRGRGDAGRDWVCSAVEAVFRTSGRAAGSVLRDKTSSEQGKRSQKSTCNSSESGFGFARALC